MALLTLDRGFDGAIIDAFHRDAVLERIELGLRHIAIGAHAIAAQPAGGGQFEHALEAAVIGEEQ
ncbi:hypothetical protein D3C81_2232300 [compost metagenome]